MMLKRLVLAAAICIAASPSDAWLVQKAAGGGAYSGPGDVGGAAVLAYLAGDAFSAADAAGGVTNYSWTCPAVGAAPGGSGNITTNTDGTLAGIATMKTDCLVLSTTGDLSFGSVTITNLASTTGLAAGMVVDVHTGGTALPPGEVTNAAVSGSSITINNFITGTVVGATLDFYNAKVVKINNRGTAGSACDLDTAIGNGVLIDPAPTAHVPIFTNQAFSDGISASGVCSVSSIPYSFFGIVVGTNAGLYQPFINLDTGSIVGMGLSSGKADTYAGTNLTSAASMNTFIEQSIGGVVNSGTSGHIFLAGTDATGTTGTATTTNTHPSLLHQPGAGSQPNHVGEMIVFSSDASSHFTALQSAECTAYTGSASC